MKKVLGLTLLVIGAAPVHGQEPCVALDFSPPPDKTLLDLANSASLRPERVSLTDMGAQIDPLEGSRNNSHPDISSNGNLVAWVTTATDVVSGQSNMNNHIQVYVRNRVMGTTSFVSFNATANAPGGNDSNFPRIADNHRIFFESKAENLLNVPDANNDDSDIFEYDANTGQLILLSRRVDNGVQGNMASNAVAPSDTGRFAAFASRATNLVSFVPGLVQQGFSNPYMACSPAPAMPGPAQVMFIDRGSGFDSGTGVPSWNYGPAIAWISMGRDAAGNCVTPHDLLGDGSVDTSDGRGVAQAASSSPDISANGCRVVFESTANNLVAGTNISDRQIYLWDRNTLAVSLVSHLSGVPGIPGDNDSFQPNISDDGRWVVFRSIARNLTSPPDADDNPEVFLADLDATPFTITKLNYGVDGVVTSYVNPENKLTIKNPFVSPGGRWATIGCNIQDYLRFPGGPTNDNLLDTLIYDGDSAGDGTFVRSAVYLHLRDPGFGSGGPYSNGSTVPIFRFTHPIGPPGQQYQEIVGTTGAQDLDTNQIPPDTNGSLQDCSDLRCADDIYVRRIWED